MRTRAPDCKAAPSNTQIDPQLPAAESLDHPVFDPLSDLVAVQSNGIPGRGSPEKTSYASRVLLGWQPGPVGGERCGEILNHSSGTSNL
jgi:hypothetical protein